MRIKRRSSRFCVNQFSQFNNLNNSALRFSAAKKGEIGAGLVSGGYVCMSFCAGSSTGLASKRSFFDYS